MVKYLLKFTAELMNFKNLEPARVDSGLSLKIRCDCGEIRSKEFTVIPHDSWSDLSKAPTTKIKCFRCEKIGSLVVISAIGKPLIEALEAKNNFVPLLEISCDGYKPIECIFGTGWKAESIAGTIFDDRDLSHGRFDGFDTNGDFPVAICNLGYSFEVISQGGKEKKSFVKRSSKNFPRRSD